MVLGILLIVISLQGAAFVFSQEGERMSNVVDQYFHILEHLLKPAYRAQGNERQVLFQRSIQALNQLIQWFKEPKDMTTACLAQFQIARAYRVLGDIPRAREEYQKCLEYERYIKIPMKDFGDTSLHAVVSTCKKNLQGL